MRDDNDISMMKIVITRGNEIEKVCQSGSDSINIDDDYPNESHKEDTISMEEFIKDPSTSVPLDFGIKILNDEEDTEVEVIPTSNKEEVIKDEQEPEDEVVDSKTEEDTDEEKSEEPKEEETTDDVEDDEENTGSDIEPQDIIEDNKNISDNTNINNKEDDIYVQRCIHCVCYKILVGEDRKQYCTTGKDDIHNIKKCPYGSVLENSKKGNNAMVNITIEDRQYVNLDDIQIEEQRPISDNEYMNDMMENMPNIKNFDSDYNDDSVNYNKQKFIKNNKNKFREE